MEPLTWTGNLAFLNPLFLFAWAVLGVSIVAQIILSFFAPSAEMQGGALAARRGPADMAALAVKATTALIVLLLLIYVAGGMIMPGAPERGIIGQVSLQFLPVWIALIAACS